MKNKMNTISADTLCAAYSYAAGIAAPAQAAAANRTLVEFIDASLQEKADRIFLYHPDAAAQWICTEEKEFLGEVYDRTSIRIPLCSPFPSITPVCFATMYTGTQPDIHLVRSRGDKVRTDTFFDSLIRAGLRPAVVASEGSSMAGIFSGRDMDYYHYQKIEEGCRIVRRLIEEDRHALISFYDGTYDAAMHKSGPQGFFSLYQLRCASLRFAEFDETILKSWKGHRTLTGFASDHGCHETARGGWHGTDTEADRNILHFYGART